MNIEMKDGRVFSGSSALEIVQQMKARAFGHEDSSVADYATWVVANTRQFENIELQVAGETDDAIAASLIGEMKRTDLVSEFADELRATS